MILGLIRQGRLSAACGLARHINISISVAGSCPGRQDGLEKGGRSNGLWLTAAESLIRVIPAVIDPVTEAAAGHAALVVARPEALPAAPVDWTQSQKCVKNTERPWQVVQQVPSAIIQKQPFWNQVLSSTPCFPIQKHSRRIIPYHSTASSRPTCLCSELCRRRSAGSWHTRRCRTRTRCGCCRRNFLLQVKTRRVMMDSDSTDIYCQVNLLTLIIVNAEMRCAFDFTPKWSFWVSESTCGCLH